MAFALRISLGQRVQAAGEAAGAEGQADAGAEKAAGKLSGRLRHWVVDREPFRVSCVVALLT